MMSMPGIIVHSGNWDRIYHAINIASVYASFDQPVIVFLTYWAIETIVKGDIVSEDDSKERILKDGLQKGIIKRLEDVARMAKSIGDVRITVCITSLNLLGIDEKDLPDWIDEIGGLAEVLSMESVMFI
jgi:peroxiredoxin family protein